jgi:hypothetical protein
MHKQISLDIYIPCNHCWLLAWMNALFHPEMH